MSPLKPIHTQWAKPPKNSLKECVYVILPTGQVL